MRKEILLILCLPILLICEDISKIKLADSQLENNLCGGWETTQSGDDTISTHIIRKCPVGEFCQGFDSNKETCDESDIRNKEFCKGFCIKSQSKALEYPGGPCKYHFECYGGFCENSKCKVISQGGDCKGHEMACDKGLSCQMKGASYSCETMLSKDGACTNDSQCEMKCICDTNKCTELFSLDNEANAEKGLACKSASVKNGKCTFNKAITPCRLFNFKSQCEITGPDDSTTNVDCIFNYDGQRACPAYKQDEVWLTEYVAQYKKVYSELKSNEMYCFERALIFNKDLAFNKLRLYNYAILKGAPEALIDAFVNNEIISKQSSGNLLNISLIPLILAVIYLV